MAFPDDVLSADEQVVVHLRPHRKALVRPVLVSLLAIAAVVGAWLVLPDNDGGRIGVLVIAAVGTFLVAAKAIPPWLIWRCTHYVLTDERVLVQTGVVRRDRRELPLDGINDHAMRQSILDRLLGSGTLTIDPLGDQGPVVFAAVPGVTGLQATLYELIEADRQRAERERAEAEQAADEQPEPDRSLRGVAARPARQPR